MWKMYPLDLGTSITDQSENTLRTGMGTKLTGAFLAWYLTDGTHKIMVDAGLPSLEIAKKYHPYTSPIIRDDQTMEAALAKLGVKPDDIELMCLTHLHWDHCGNMPLFKNAKFYVSKTELQFAVDPCPNLWSAFESHQHTGEIPPYLRVLPQIQTIKMEETEILPGITMFPTPGHTPGSMAVAVETTDGTYVLSGDAVACYQNIQGNPAKGWKYFPIGIYTNMIEVWDSLAAIHKKANYKIDHIFPGHDTKILEHAVYPIE